MPKSPSWTEEISRFLFVYSISFGAPLALKKEEYVKVDIIISKLPLKVQDKIDSIIYLLLSIFFILIGYTGYEFGMLGLYQTSPAMQLPMLIPYMSISISCIFLMIYSFYKVKERFAGKGRQDILEEILEKKEVNE